MGNSPTLDGVRFRPYIGKARNDDTGMTTDASSTGNSIPPTAKSVSVESRETDANDWITLPAAADVAPGHEITILANAGGNFELRTPANSGTKINDVDADGTQEYLVTDTDVLIARFISSTVGWVVQSITKLGAVRTAVVPD